MSIQTINPATEEKLAEYPLLSSKDVDLLIERAEKAFLDWRETSFEFRRQPMLALSDLLRRKKKELALLIAREMGKPIAQGEAEIEKCAWLADHYAEKAEDYLKPQTIQTELQKSTVYYQPLGIVFAIMPWNFPFWQVYRCAIPAIMAGNAVILKHAPVTTGCGFAIEKQFIEAGFPHHLFQQAVVDNEGAAALIAHDKIASLSFTGSEKAGRVVAANAASHLKKSVLELGGSDPYLVLDDADLDLAADCIIKSRLNNCGQVCIAAKRIIAVASVHDELVAKIQQRLQHYAMGEPVNPETTLGPMAREDLRDTLHQQVLESVKQGARLLNGGALPAGPGFYYPPTLLVNVKPGMTAFEEELFGPVIAVIQVDNEEEGIRLANQSPYGLAGAVFTRDIVRGEDIAKNRIEAGSCFVNALVASDPRLPFGGIKHSGYGRELSREGILEFVNIKTVAIK
ncbi:succinate semialdehyde dehydrogenase [Legionella rubrilucens]|uniref:Succinate semialdehyde dehydrogenase n=1 Tax=Legionella rubrilucens TaxID=458 RepID=A0A0W0XY52_9GAMM|nr:NAD-dependent succinate-semialdehyde dehydrogenase [Legionella rubrilucens]KTD49509.1 succinate semialdehyde dehydrogenase [Legionella rubrilucens]